MVGQAHHAVELGYGHAGYAFLHGAGHGVGAVDGEGAEDRAAAGGRLDHADDAHEVDGVGAGFAVDGIGAGSGYLKLQGCRGVLLGVALRSGPVGIIFIAGREAESGHEDTCIKGLCFHGECLLRSARAGGGRGCGLPGARMFHVCLLDEACAVGEVKVYAFAGREVDAVGGTLVVGPA